MNCPKCNSDALTIVGEFARCQACEAYFEPPARPEPPPVPRPALKFVHPKFGTRQLAEHFTTAALIFCAFSGLAVVGIILNMASADPASALLCLYCLIGFLAAAFWLFLLAQIIHIRANTEK